jgi:hypothetical protein
MAHFAKFDPKAFLESERRVADPRKTPKDPNRPKTLAGLATLAGLPSQIENQGAGDSDTTVDDHGRSKNQKLRPTPAKVAKVAKVDPLIAATEADPWDDVEEERAAVIEYDGCVPGVWAEALARLDPNKPPGDVPLQRWLRFIDDCGRFLDSGWAVRAAAFGWGPLDLFGCRERPFARVDHLGLLWLVNGGAVRELHRNRAILETEHGTRQSYRRRPVEVGRIVPAWELALS